MALDHGPALLAAQCAVDTLISIRVLEEQCRGQGDVDGAGGRHVGELALELLVHPIEARCQQRCLVGVVSVEGRSADVGPIEDVLDGGLLVALLDGKRDERIVEQLAGAPDPPIRRCGRRTPGFPDNSSAMFGIGHLASIGC